MTPRTLPQFICNLSAAAGIGWLAQGNLSACPPECFDSTEEAHGVALSAVAEVQRRAVDLAICLDTSGSMQGLIDAARMKLWDIVNDLALAKPTPRLRVALLTYGNNGHNAENGWVSVDAPFTEDLDLVSQKLFALTTNGGTELVGRVLDAAGKQLDWSAEPDALKIAIVAGNESADQDQVMPYRDICRALIARGIMIDSIYCGPAADGIAPGWREVATLADGHFAAIDHENGTIVVSTPFDSELASLSTELNTTYLAFGAVGKEAARNQQEQDVNAAHLNTAVAAQRCETKAGAMYQNVQWDLVDACKQADFKLDDVKEEDLPEPMRAMTIDQRRAMVQEMEQRRAAIQAKANELASKRQQFVAEEMKKQAGTADKSFDTVIRKAVRSQAESRGFQFEDKQTAAPADGNQPGSPPAGSESPKPEC